MMNKPSILIVSGGVGTSGSQLVRTALAQFLTHDITVTIVPQVRHAEELEQVISQAASMNGMIVHTLVDETLRTALTQLAKANHIIEVDLMGPLLQQLTHCMGQKPVGQPGLYRKMREQDLKRIEAIEFAVDHDDGKRAHELHQAEIVLTGVSRVGKTPLSMYLSTLGWKVANVPLVPGVNPPSGLFEIDRRRVFGLTIEPGQLVAYRLRRGHHLGIAVGSSYAAPLELIEELEFAREVFRRGQFAIMDTTDKPIEESADEIIAMISRRLKLIGD
jgi:regulator of PEP synthase PpsR (kinase-PPPase family)